MNIKDLIKKQIKKYGQGDVIIRLIPEIDLSCLEESVGNILISGQHNHMVRGDVKVYKSKDMTYQIVKCFSSGEIYHTAQKAHAPIPLEKGTYLITQRREVDMVNDMIKVVED